MGLLRVETGRVPDAQADPKKDWAWVVEEGAKEYLGCELECLDRSSGSPLYLRLYEKAKAKKEAGTTKEIEPQSLDAGQCPCASPADPPDPRGL